MTYILSTDLDFYSKKDTTQEDYEYFNIKWKEYYEYLKSLKGIIPDSAYEFANADWHYKAYDARCLHDTWLEELNVGEVSKEDDKFNLKQTEIYIKLLGAYHNGHLEIKYINIHEYSMKSERQFFFGEIKGGFYHHDWLRDEIRLSENGFVVHEIEWVNARWIIECEDIEYRWIPFESNQLNDMEEVFRIEAMEKQKEEDKEIYQKIRNGGVGFYKYDLRGIVEVSGGEAVQFLNGLITNDIEKLGENKWMYAAFPNAKGRMLAVVRALRLQDKFIFETEGETYEKVLANLSRFTFAGDFNVDDLTKKRMVISIQGEKSAEILGNTINADLISIEENEVFYKKFKGSKIQIIKSVLNNGFEIIAPIQQGEQLLTELKMSEMLEISPWLYETLRIENGIPKYNVDMNEETVVPEVGLENLISYNKGCYIGQEVIARIHFRGKVAKELKGLIFEDESPNINPNDEIKTTDDKNAGTITSTTYSPKLEKTIALGYVRNAFLDEGTELKVGEFTAKVKTLPFID